MVKLECIRKKKLLSGMFIYDSQRRLVVLERAGEDKTLDVPNKRVSLDGLDIFDKPHSIGQKLRRAAIDSAYELLGYGLTLTDVKEFGDVEIEYNGGIILQVKYVGRLMNGSKLEVMKPKRHSKYRKVNVDRLDVYPVCDNIRLFLDDLQTVLGNGNR